MEACVCFRFRFYFDSRIWAADARGASTRRRPYRTRGGHVGAAPTIGFADISRRAQGAPHARPTIPRNPINHLLGLHPNKQAEQAFFILWGGKRFEHHGLS
ncbi:hypothetical protein [Cyclonatronum proteinivorum]|nr:hypothetical protein [Cyclonatronum proteinivorum]